MVSPDRVLYILSEIGIKHSPPDSNGWVNCKCVFPGHKDTHPSAGFNINTLVYKCFRCGTTNLYKIVQQFTGCSYKDAITHVEGDFEINATLNLNKRQDIQSYYLDQKNVKSIIEPKFYLEKLIDFTPDDYDYTLSRGFTREFCNSLGIKLCIDGYLTTSKNNKLPLNDYIIIPIIDIQKNIDTFEARNIVRNEHDYRPKVLYPTNSNINDTLLNIDNLNYNEDLYVCEGSGSLPKIYSSISKNVTCIFGASITDEQLKYLLQFNKKIIFLSDWDEASYNMLFSIRKELDNAYVFKERTEDIDHDFIEKLNHGYIEVSRFLLRI